MERWDITALKKSKGKNRSVYREWEKITSRMQFNNKNNIRKASKIEKEQVVFQLKNIKYMYIPVNCAIFFSRDPGTLEVCLYNSIIIAPLIYADMHRYKA